MHHYHEKEPLLDHFLPHEFTQRISILWTIWTTLSSSTIRAASFFTTFVLFTEEDGQNDDIFFCKLVDHSNYKTYVYYIEK